MQTRLSGPECMQWNIIESDDDNTEHDYNNNIMYLNPLRNSTHSTFE